MKARLEAEGVVESDVPEAATPNSSSPWFNEYPRKHHCFATPTNTTVSLQIIRLTNSPGPLPQIALPPFATTTTQDLLVAFLPRPTIPPKPRKPLKDTPENRSYSA